MRTEEETINGYSRLISDDSFAGRGNDSSPITSSNLLSTAPSVNYIEHRVTKMDTLAGVAIKYGVEVADIKRLNGLVTDRQMFAHKSLQIPLPGRHPPSPNLSNGSACPGESSNGYKMTRQPYTDLLDSFQTLKLKSSPQPRKVSQAMSSLQGYYGLTTSSNKSTPEGTEMYVYRKQRERENYLEHESPQKATPPPVSSQPLSHWKSKSLANSHSPENSQPHWKSKSLANSHSPENGRLSGELHVADAGDSEAERSNEKAVRRRQKADTDTIARSPEVTSRDDGSGSGNFGMGGRRPAPRPKSSSRTNLAADAESGRLSVALLGDTLVADGFASVRKSNSTSNLQDSENTSIWPTAKWNLKPDLQGISAAAIARPIFDGLPKPITGWRNKTALD